MCHWCHCSDVTFVNFIAFFDTLVQTYYMSIAESVKHWPGVCVSACPVTWSVWYCPTSSNEWGKWHIASLVIVRSKPAHSQCTFPCFHLSTNSLHGKPLELRNEHEPALLQKTNSWKLVCLYKKVSWVMWAWSTSEIEHGCYFFVTNAGTGCTGRLSEDQSCELWQHWPGEWNLGRVGRAHE